METSGDCGTYEELQGLASLGISKGTLFWTLCVRVRACIVRVHVHVHMHVFVCVCVSVYTKVLLELHLKGSIFLSK